MKSTLLGWSLVLALTSCGGNQTPAASTEKKDLLAVNEKALELIGSKGCTACHAISKKQIGPAYTEVAKKYEPTEKWIDSLAQKVIKGGKGVWGDVAMTPNNVTPEEAKLMVTYILSLKNQ